jgi:LysM repeat protein
MIYLSFVVFWVCISSSYAQQYYDSSDCYSDMQFPGSKYTCNSFQISSCKTVLIYRAKQHVQTIERISDMFHLNSTDVLALNNLTSPSEKLKPGREVVVPINCSCSGQFFQANFSYTVQERTTFSQIACEDFEGLVKSLTLQEMNRPPQAGSQLHVPLRCACPDNFSLSNGVNYLVTYPIIEGDGPRKLIEKFGISPEDFLAVNHLHPEPTVFPGTTVLLPLKAAPVIDFSTPDSPPPTHVFLPTNPTDRTPKRQKLSKLYIAGSVAGFSLLLVALVACGVHIMVLKKWKGDQNFQSITARSSPRSGQTGGSSTNSCLSPDLLAGIKYSLFIYSMEELRKATRDFSEEMKIADEVYKGLIDNVEVMIKKMRFEDTWQVIDLHSKINHINIVNLQGVCYGENHAFSDSYLVFEFPSNGSLRHCLSNPSITLQWHRRTQIAFDIATGLHYLHYCTFLTHARMSLSSRNIFMTANWRAKIANIGTPLKGNYDEENDRGWVAPAECLLHGSAAEKADIFAFGVVLLELISAREDFEGKPFKESIKFLGEDSGGGCFEQLRSFMDPSLKNDYSLAEVLCLAVLAKACVEDDHLHRPSMDDIMKVLARIS